MKKRYTSWKDDFTVIDTETTGMDESARVLEVGLVRYVKRKLAARLQLRVNPGSIDWTCPSVQKALEINGIRKLDVEGLPTLHQVDDIIYRHLVSRVWVGHNLKFDVRMLSQSWAMGADFPLSVLELDTVVLDFGLRPGKASRKLASVCCAWNVVNRDAHTALADADATAQVLMMMMNKLPDSNMEMQSLHAQWEREWKAARA